MLQGIRILEDRNIIGTDDRILLFVTLLFKPLIDVRSQKKVIVIFNQW